MCWRLFCSRHGRAFSGFVPIQCFWRHCRLRVCSCAKPFAHALLIVCSGRRFGGFTAWLHREVSPIGVPLQLHRIVLVVVVQAHWGLWQWPRQACTQHLAVAVMLAAFCGATAAWRRAPPAPQVVVPIRRARLKAVGRWVLVAAAAHAGIRMRPWCWRRETCQEQQPLSSRRQMSCDGAWPLQAGCRARSHWRLRRRRPSSTWWRSCDRPVGVTRSCIRPGASAPWPQ
mmetsp:Transcript_10846/g.38034  ORF Transcript_10846/g.38034 Transcript_10846/m.38034 type:complete len:228 (-) Transcript_10846:288-971(-)